MEKRSLSLIDTQYQVHPQTARHRKDVQEGK